MNCPKCSEEMKVEIGEQTAKLKTDEEFLRTVYHCEICNVYVGVYLPIVVSN